MTEESNQETKNWLVMVDYDLTTAGHMLKAGRYVYVIFMCHLAIEKILKAIVGQATQKIPPRTHDLIHLIDLGQIKLADDLLDFIGKINNVSVVTRYPEDFPTLVKSYPKDVTKDYLNKTVEIIQCLKQDKRLKK